VNSKVLLPFYVFSTLVVTASCVGTPSAPAGTAGTRIIQPGAPGEMAQAFDTAELDAIRGLDYSEADVRFMRGMIPHHGQALDMTAMVPARATTDGFRGLALRMQISQRDEIRLMERWLAEREEEVPAANLHWMMMSGDMELMPGMLNARHGAVGICYWPRIRATIPRIYDHAPRGSTHHGTDALQLLRCGAGVLNFQVRDGC